jgi:hypothetical protein
MNWHAEPFWRWWYAQPEIVALMVPKPELDAELQRMAKNLGRLLTGHARQDSDQRLGALRYGGKHWKRRR